MLLLISTMAVGRMACMMGEDAVSSKAGRTWCFMVRKGFFVQERLNDNSLPLLLEKLSSDLD